LNTGKKQTNGPDSSWKSHRHSYANGGTLQRNNGGLPASVDGKGKTATTFPAVSYAF
jgi:hypothetical protein